MSLPFNDTTNYKGLVQIFEKEAGFNRTDVSGSTDRLKEFAADANLAMDDFWTIALTASGKWQLDDTNQTDYPIITTNLVSGQRDYSFLTDGSSNLILDIYRVAILPSATSTIYQEIKPIDVQGDPSWTNNILSNTATSGVPAQYDKTSNAIFLDPYPSYNATNGLKMWINREPSYFLYTDTTKKPGVAGIFHRYFAIKPAMEYARRKKLKSYVGLAQEILRYEGDEDRGIIGSIARYYGKRSKDERNIMTGKKINFI